jgi:soluble lytic murein transglycosylase
MLRKFDNNRILASAAYNAGPGRVNQWLNPNVPFDVWIEIIPFTETRNYVQNVLMFSSIYSRRMNERQPLIYPHERNYFSPQQVSAIRALAEKLSVKPPENM